MTEHNDLYGLETTAHLDKDYEVLDLAKRCMESEQWKVAERKKQNGWGLSLHQYCQLDRNISSPHGPAKFEIWYKRVDLNIGFWIQASVCPDCFLKTLGHISRLRKEARSVSD